MISRSNLNVRFTFLFSDLKGSTKLYERYFEALADGERVGPVNIAEGLIQRPR